MMETARGQAERGFNAPYRRKTPMKNAKAKRGMLLFLSVLFTLLTVVSIFALRYAAEEMRHEALTYSQWYEGTIYGYYGCLMIVCALAGIALGCWAGWLLTARPVPAPGKRGRAALGVLFAVFLLLALFFVFRSIASYGEIGRAAEANVECLAPYIEAYGRNRLWALLSLEAAAFSLLPAIQGKR